MPASPFATKYALLGGLTAAELEALPGPSGSPACYVDEFSATYRWNAGSAVAIDHYRVLGATGGVAGRWILEGTELTLQPAGAGDWARYAAAALAMAGHGKLKLAAGSV